LGSNSLTWGTPKWTNDKKVNIRCRENRGSKKFGSNLLNIRGPFTGPNHVPFTWERKGMPSEI